jgi:hypothetical protein
VGNRVEDKTGVTYPGMSTEDAAETARQRVGSGGKGTTE